MRFEVKYKMYDIVVDTTRFHRNRKVTNAAEKCIGKKKHRCSSYPALSRRCVQQPLFEHDLPAHSEIFSLHEIPV